MPTTRAKTDCKIDLSMGDFADWDLPARYRKALRKHVGSTPTRLQTSWPVHAMPDAEDEITFNTVAASHADWVAGKKWFSVGERGSLTVWIDFHRKQDDESRFDLHTLLSFAEAGFEMESGVKITTILRNAKLALKEA